MNALVRHFSFPNVFINRIAYLNSLYSNQTRETDLLINVYVNDEMIMIPYRIYHLEPSVHLFDSLDVDHRNIIYCYFTRHHDGKIRERNLLNIISLNEPWIVPYIIQLIGEYVIEILDVIWSNFENFEINLYRDFINNNPIYFSKIKQKMISYWDCYYRYKYPNINNYVGYKLVNALEFSGKL